MLSFLLAAREIWCSPFFLAAPLAWHSPASWLLLFHGALPSYGCSGTVVLSSYMAAHFGWCYRPPWLLPLGGEAAHKIWLFPFLWLLVRYGALQIVGCSYVMVLF